MREDPSFRVFVNAPANKIAPVAMTMGGSQTMKIPGIEK